MTGLTSHPPEDPPPIDPRTIRITQDGEPVNLVQQVAEPKARDKSNNRTVYNSTKDAAVDGIENAADWTRDRWRSAFG